MKYKTIVVYFEREAQVEGLLDYVAPLALAHGAHLIGVCVLPSYFRVPASEVGTTALIEDIRNQYRSTTAAAMQAAFEKALRGETFGSEWRTIDPGFHDCIDAVGELGNTADLIVACQELAGEHDEGYRDGLGLLAVTTARPVLLLPHKDKPASPPQSIIVAWDGSQQAARAVFDGLGLLQSAAKVTLIRIRWPDEFADDGEVPHDEVRFQQGVDICDALARHGVDATIAVETPWENDIAKTLLKAATTHRADLIMLGGYGHSRLREWIFGGVTRSVLRHMTTPVLLSH
jgi:nucleotide-binding universal stress UspA family protein